VGVNGYLPVAGAARCRNIIYRKGAKGIYKKTCGFNYFHQPYGRNTVGDDNKRLSNNFLDIAAILI
jgi:hypothetical protein